MSAAPAAAHSANAPEQHGAALTGTGTLLRFMLRRDRIRLPLWIGGIALMMVYLCLALPSAYATEEDLRGALALFTDPVGRMLIGPGYGLDDPTYARMIANGYSLYLMLLTALMSIFLVVRHTRGEEQSGRAEMIRANVVGRHAALTATLILALLANLAAGLAVFGVMVAVGGHAAAGSLLLAASVAAAGITFAGVAAITVQLTAFSGPASGMAGGVLGLAFVVRAGGDMARSGGSLLSWCSPLAWGQQTGPFALDRWWPLTLSLLFTAATTALGVVLSTRRDLGASLVAVRPGPARARPLLGSAWGLALRLHRGSFLVWTLGIAIGGLTFGAFAEGLLNADDLPDTILEVFGEGDLLAGYFAYIATFMGYLITIVAILAVQSLRADETGGRLEPLLATPVSRVRWLSTNLAITAAAVVLIAAFVGAASGLGAALVTGEPAYISDLTLAHLNQVPAIWVVLGATACAFGLLPRSLPAAWMLVGYSMLVGTFGPLLNLPRITLSLSPFEHPAAMPLEEFAPLPLLVLTALALLLATAGVAGFRRRDIEGS